MCSSSFLNINIGLQSNYLKHDPVISFKKGNQEMTQLERKPHSKNRGEKKLN